MINTMDKLLEMEEEREAVRADIDSIEHQITLYENGLSRNGSNDPGWEARARYALVNKERVFESLTRKIEILKLQYEQHTGIQNTANGN